VGVGGSSTIDRLFFAFSIAERNKGIRYCFHAVIISATTFMQGTYSYISGTNHGFRVYNVVTCNVTSHDKRFLLLHQYFPQYECGAQYGCFL
jgi:hypothetical protein